MSDIYLNNKYRLLNGRIIPSSNLTPLQEKLMKQHKDFVPALLQPNEIVIPLKYVKRIGKLMEELGIYDITSGKFK